MSNTMTPQPDSRVSEKCDPQPLGLSGIPKREVYRKILHMTPGLLPFVLRVVPHPDPLDLLGIIIVAACCLVLTVVFLAFHRTVRRPGENNLLSTAISYPSTVITTLVLFPQHVEFTMVVVSVLAFGDGSAYFGGKLFGKQKLPWNREKSWAGSICFICCAAPIATMAYFFEARPAVSLATAALCGTAATVTGALAESIPTKITDNLRVGVAASVAVIAAHFLVV